MAEAKRKYAGLSLDLDNQWSYMKIHGDKAWEEYPTYLPVFIPYILDLLDEINLKITFFVVGRDAEMPVNQPYLERIVARGHGFGNHSFNHDSWLHKYPGEKLHQEIAETQKVLAAIQGSPPQGFRGPGFTWSKTLLEVLAGQGIRYDSSTLPTWIGPLARKYYFMTSSLSEEEKEERGELFGTWSDGRRPVNAYWWKLEKQKKILEIPVSTIPMLKVPFHLSYLLYLSSLSVQLMRAYLATAIRFLKISGTSPCFLLHPLDLIGGDQLKSLKFFPGMNMRSDEKVAVFKEVINRLSRHFQFLSMDDFAEELSHTNLPERIPV